jgi:phosphoribosylformylglycinamidine synthase subunit PurQ / glutaminase
MSVASVRVGVVSFPGSLDDRDAIWALSAVGADAVPIWHADSALGRVDAVILPGGFSYGDYLRCGAIASLAPAMQALREFAAAGGLVLGICNGFQILCEAGLLPGVLRRNRSLDYVCRDVDVVVERAGTPFTGRCAVGEVLTLPVKHGEGCYHAPDDLDDAQIVFRYEPASNPNGSERDIAGVCNAEGNVVGLMPHPEHAVDPLQSSGDGALILASLVDSVLERRLARA